MMKFNLCSTNKEWPVFYTAANIFLTFSAIAALTKAMLTVIYQVAKHVLQPRLLLDTLLACEIISRGVLGFYFVVSAASQFNLLHRKRYLIFMFKPFTDASVSNNGFH